jgi:superfamily II DNA helicase RecQ
MLMDNGYPATRYHAGLEEAERSQNQEDFLHDRSTVMVATNAFGMGIDKSNVSYVIHYNMPKSMEAYYQEAGRAGRDGTDADCILLYNGSDVTTARFLISRSAENEELEEAQREQIRQQEGQRRYYQRAEHAGGQQAPGQKGSAQAHHREDQRVQAGHGPRQQNVAHHAQTQGKHSGGNRGFKGGGDGRQHGIEERNHTPEGDPLAEGSLHQKPHRGCRGVDQPFDNDFVASQHSRASSSKGFQKNQ